MAIGGQIFKAPQYFSSEFCKKYQCWPTSQRWFSMLAPQCVGVLRLCWAPHSPHCALTVQHRSAGLPGADPVRVLAQKHFSSGKWANVLERWTIVMVFYGLQIWGLGGSITARCHQIEPRQLDQPASEIQCSSHTRNLQINSINGLEMCNSPAAQHLASYYTLKMNYNHNNLPIFSSRLHLLILTLVCHQCAEMEVSRQLMALLHKAGHTFPSIMLLCDYKKNLLYVNQKKRNVCLSNSWNLLLLQCSLTLCTFRAIFSSEIQIILQKIVKKT